MQKRLMAVGFPVTWLMPCGFLAHILSLTSFLTMTSVQSEPSMSPRSSMLAPLTMAPERLASLKIVPVRLHCPRLALVRSAPVKSASVRSAPKRVTPARLLPLNLARLSEPLV